MSKADPPIPDLAALLAEASSPTASCTVPLKQGLRAQIAALEADLEQAAEGELLGDARMSSKNPLRKIAEEIEAKRAEMAASALTFRFTALDREEREAIRQAMGGRDNPDEINLRAIAGMCREVTGPKGEVLPGLMEWTDFRDLRKTLGVRIFDETIDAAATEASGGDWSVPFSSSASLILATEK